MTVTSVLVGVMVASAGNIVSEAVWLEGVLLAAGLLSSTKSCWK